MFIVSLVRVSPTLTHLSTPPTLFISLYRSLSRARNLYLSPSFPIILLLQTRVVLLAMQRLVCHLLTRT